MRRVDLLVDEKQYKYLVKLPGHASEHIRRAITEYIQSIEGKNVSASASKNRGEVNG